MQGLSHFKKILNMRKYVYCIMLFSLWACINSEKSKLSTEHQLQVLDQPDNPFYEMICVLNETPCLLGEITSLCFLNEERIIISTIKPSRIVVFDREGNQITCLDRTGRGPMEFLNPSILKSCDKHIYVWCDQQLKLIIYDEILNPIKQFTGFMNAIKDFAVLNNKIYFYLSGGLNENLIRIFHLEREEFIHELGGKVTEESILLSLFAGAGGLFVTDSALFYSTPSDLVVYSWCQENDLYESVEFLDIDFKVANINNAVQMINSDRNKAIEYVSSNSVVKGIYDLKDKIVLVTEVGEYNLEKKDITSTRFNKYYILNNIDKQVTAFKEEMDFSKISRSFAGFNGSLYFIKFNPAKEFELYSLKRMVF